MRLDDDLHVLPLRVQRGDLTLDLNLSLVLDPGFGHTLVDAGLPGQEDAIATSLAEVGLRVRDLARIVITHQDIDHVGSLHGMVEASGARVLAHEIEAPFIDGLGLAAGR